jgi:hypothetical protein
MGDGRLEMGDWRGMGGKTDFSKRLKLSSLTMTYFKLDEPLIRIRSCVHAEEIEIRSPFAGIVDLRKSEFKR